MSPSLTPEHAPATRRRRLWQLPTQAHELLLALSFPPHALRRETARTLGQVRGGVCILKGRDADVLYSVVHDMGTRNPLSEALHKRLEERHALVVRRMATLRELDALNAVWAQALVDDEMPACLWALMTHPVGATLETAPLYDARAWLFAHVRRSVGQMQAQVQEAARTQDARLQADDLRVRLGAHQQQAAQALGRAQAEVARLTGEVARLQRLREDTAPPVAPLCASKSAHPEAQTTMKARATVMGQTTPPTTRQPPHALSKAHAQPPLPQSQSQPIVVHGQRVLCVGGIQHAVARYRGRIEKLGGYFEHHDGGLEDSVQALDGQLRRADLVICQAACINHEAYHRVKRHCERTGTPCVYLDRPSLSRLDRALAPAPAPVSASVSAVVSHPATTPHGK